MAQETCPVDGRVHALLPDGLNLSKSMTRLKPAEG